MVENFRFHEQRLVWRDITVRTFLHFCQFAYNGDFDIHHPEIHNGQDIPASVESLDLGQWLVQNAEVIALADYYGVDDLISHAMAKLNRSLATLLPRLRRNHTDPTAVEAVTDLLDYCYDPGRPQVLRDAVEDILRKCSNTLYDYRRCLLLAEKYHPLSLKFSKYLHKPHAR
jgi:hypothetical protein